MRELTLQPNQLSLPITSMKVPGCNLIPRVSKFCFEEWQDIWNCCPGNKLHAIYTTVGSAQHSKIPSHKSHHKEVVINRLRLGHSRLTQSYLFSGDDQPTCVSCNLPLTIMHILLECPNLECIWHKYFNVDISSLRILFESIDNQNIIDFI